MLENHDTFLSVSDFSVNFETPYGSVRALDHVKLGLGKNEIVCLVGESGCGKSTLGLSLIGLLPMPPARVVSGKILYKDNDVTKMKKEDLRLLRGTEIFMIFQEPMSSLNPVLTIQEQLMEAVRVRNERAKNGNSSSNRERYAEIVESLKMVQVPDPERILHGYPHQLSGGMRQRIMIAMALILKPSLLIADEPTTALDVSTQDQILDLFKKLVGSELQTTVLFITHDLALARVFAQRITVMYAGEVVEDGSAEDVLSNPKHPYTVGLLKCLPKGHKSKATIDTIPGTVPDLVHPPSGCKFHPRCAFAMAKCATSTPGVYAPTADHRVRCFLFE